jgi:hypothetical protein
MHVMVMMVMPVIDRDHASGVGNRATHMFELNSRMVNVESVAQHVFDLMQDVVAL